MPPPADPGGPALARSLGLLDATLLGVGTMVCSGIFFVPASIARQLGPPWLQLGVWVVAALISLFGALTFATLGVALPRAGGLLVYLKEAYGPVWGYLYGWALFAIVQSGSIAAVSVAFATALSELAPMPRTPVAVGVICALTALNVVGVRTGVWAQNLVTFAKILVIAGLVGLAASARSGSVAHLTTTPGAAAPATLGGFAVALVAALWAFDGWIHTSYVAGEIREPARTLPRANLLAVALVMLLYLALNLAYLWVLGADGVAASALPAADTAAARLGRAGAGFAALLVLLATLGAANGMVLAGARVTYAMAKEGMFLPAAGRIDPRLGTPAIALVLQGAWAAGLVFSGRYEQLFTCVIFAEWIFFGMGAAAVFVLPGRGHALPYRAPGGHAVVALFLVATAALLAGTLIETPREALLGLGILVAGLPAYLYFRQPRRRETG